MGMNIAEKILSRTGTVLQPLPVPEPLLALMQGGGIFPLMEKEGLIAPER